MPLTPIQADVLRVISENRTEYHVDFDLIDEVDLHLVIGEGGEILRHREEADF